MEDKPKNSTNSKKYLLSAAHKLHLVCTPLCLRISRGILQGVGGFCTGGGGGGGVLALAFGDFFFALFLGTTVGGGIAAPLEPAPAAAPPPPAAAASAAFFALAAFLLAAASFLSLSLCSARFISFLKSFSYFWTHFSFSSSAGSGSLNSLKLLASSHNNMYATTSSRFCHLQEKEKWHT